MRNNKFIERLSAASAYVNNDKCDFIFNTMQTIYESKDSDYCDGEIPMQNLRACEELGIIAWKGTLIRMCDKKRRIQSFNKKGSFKVEDEKLEDTLMDMANYALLASILIEEDNSLPAFLIDGAIDILVRIAGGCVMILCSIHSKPLDSTTEWTKVLQLWELIANISNGIMVGDDNAFQRT